MYISSTSIKSQVEALLGVDDKVAQVSTKIQGIGNRIYISNVSQKTEVKIYSITGALVKSLETSQDTNFEFRTGLYIGILKTADGQKAVKLVVK